tara:strand:+ start:142 stop:381 length:240 start_codon:yes stop_codon:yes gene_type:complete
MALGPLLEGRETRSPDGIPVTRLVLFQQPVADQKLHATLANFDWRGHDNTPGAALAEASCTDGGCWFMGHLSSSYNSIF